MMCQSDHGLIFSLYSSNITASSLYLWWIQILVYPLEVITDLTSFWLPNRVPTHRCSRSDSDDRNLFLTATTNVTQKFAGTRIPQSLTSHDTADVIIMSVSCALLSESFPQGSFLVCNHEWPVLNTDPNVGQIHIYMRCLALQSKAAFNELIWSSHNKSIQHFGTT